MAGLEMEEGAKELCSLWSRKRQETDPALEPPEEPAPPTPRGSPRALRTAGPRTAGPRPVLAAAGNSESSIIALPSCSRD